MPQEDRRVRLRNLGWFIFGVALPVPWVVIESLGGSGLRAEWVAPLAGAAILGAAFMLSWSCELAERDIPEGLALLVLALVGVLPEYAVDLHFAWTAGKDPSYAPYAVANMTGANRLLIGFGWTAVVLVACRRGRKASLEVHPRQRLELRFLIWATLYSFVIPLSGTINLFDCAVLFALFAAYVRAALRGEYGDEVELAGPAALIDAEFGQLGRRLWAAVFLVFAGWAIYIGAEPFADGLVHIGRTYEVDEFLLVQWVAPIASESPEFVIAILFALKLRGSLGIGALISSKVNQWTLLVGAIPIAFALSSGTLAGLPLDERQAEELLLTSAQSLLAAIVIVNLRFHRWEAICLAVLFAGQLLFSSTATRWWFVAIYLLLSAGILMNRRQRRFFLELTFSLPSSDRSRPASSEPQLPAPD